MSEAEQAASAPETPIEGVRRADVPPGWTPGQVENRFVGPKSFVPATYNAKTRSVEAVFSTSYRVRRWFGWEELAIREDAIDMKRLALGQLRLLDHHNQYERGAVLGFVTDARIDNGALVGTIRFADSEAGREAERQVASGELTGVSVGYRINKLVLAETSDNDDDVYRAESWELLEVSLVSVPADPFAGVRSAANPSRIEPPGPAGQQKEPSMADNAIAAPATEPGNEANRAAAPAPAPVPAPTAPVVDAEAVRAAERARISDINRIAREHNIDADTAQRAVDGATSVEAFRGIVLDVLAERSRRDAAVPARPSAQEGARAQVTRDETETRRTGMALAIAARMARASGERNVELPEQARAYGEMGFAEMAAECIGYRGPLRTAPQATDVLSRAFHTTSDFPAILMDAMNRRLLARYQTAAPTYRRFCARYTVADFRPMNIIRAGDFPALQAINEAGEIKSGTFSESKEQIVVKPYGVKLSITRQMIVNDQLGAIDQVLGSTGARVADWENAMAFAMLAEGSGAGPVLLTDNKRVFHADHGNLPSAAAINVASIGIARALMMKQKTLDGLIANFQPNLLLTGPDKVTEAEQLLSTIVPAQQSNAIPESMRRLSPVADANISGNAWYLFSDPSVAPCFLYAYLEGFEGPRLTAEDVFDVQGMKIKLEHDFGVAGIDFRGGVRNPGA